ncbi:hypothetical protein EIN_043780 [Entamoeba invadens IP1]|uniref:Uncharacterized protein n=1 Tax=Entamoeba invadens IP1 TaxID=370355 RepID=A0A0A1TZ41_ENTIV|nr:hypothetical protein EIN_043780 [Entamoeba invadens IP1]ELP86840.1 hypothetical protein EIN_043780 [Entamoeba invadens IP1]|eukprot:XP_004253611.1 hypothetical protein EIN_043780 [Entamoeba invadens IP1]
MDDDTSSTTLYPPLESIPITHGPPLNAEDVETDVNTIQPHESYFSSCLKNVYLFFHFIFNFLCNFDQLIQNVKDGTFLRWCLNAGCVSDTLCECLCYCKCLDFDFYDEECKCPCYTPLCCVPCRVILCCNYKHTNCENAGFVNCCDCITRCCDESCFFLTTWVVVPLQKISKLCCNPYDTYCLHCLSVRSVYGTCCGVMTCGFCGDTVRYKKMFDYIWMCGYCDEKMCCPCNSLLCCKCCELNLFYYPCCVVGCCDCKSVYDKNVAYCEQSAEECRYFCAQDSSKEWCGCDISV